MTYTVSLILSINADSECEARIEFDKIARLNAYTDVEVEEEESGGW